MEDKMISGRHWTVLLIGVLATSAVSCGDDSDGGSGGGSGCATGSCTNDTTQHTGEATYYDATGAGNCGFPATPDDLMVGAMNQTDYAASAVCGACAAGAESDSD